MAVRDRRRVRVSWFQLWTVCWQVTVVLTPIMLGAAVLWLNSRFVSKQEMATQVQALIARADSDRVAFSADVKRLDDTRHDHESRIRVAEADIARPPSRHQLNNAIAVMQGGLNALEKAMTALTHQSESQGADIRRQMETMSGYLHTVIEKHLG
jgi:hypothetical protein